jgi:DnaJ-class molecular chaperone
MAETTTRAAFGGARKCPTCNGTGINPVLPTNVCPKCNGEKTVPSAWR